MSVLINASTSTGLVQSADTSGEIELQSNGTTALKVNANEGIQILNCLGVGNATPSTSGAGITFPATQSASTDANTLDDYEEGTYTPFITIGGSTTGITYSAQVGHYVKVGGVCTISGYLLISSKGGLSGATNFAGFPFTTKTLGNLYAGPATGVYGGLTGITAYGLGFDIGPSGTTGTFVFGNGTGCTVLNGNNITNTFSLQWSITYSTN